MNRLIRTNGSLNLIHQRHRIFSAFVADRQIPPFHGFPGDTQQSRPKPLYWSGTTPRYLARREHPTTVGSAVTMTDSVDWPDFALLIQFQVGFHLSLSSLSTNGSASLRVSLSLPLWLHVRLCRYTPHYNSCSRLFPLYSYNSHLCSRDLTFHSLVFRSFPMSGLSTMVWPC